MPDRHHDLLEEALFSIRGGKGGSASFPELLAQLSAGEDLDLAALQPHQQHAWHAFLVQLAALALHRGGCQEPPSEADVWKELILALTEGACEPWCLVVDDLSKPAFFQPPVPEGELQSLRNLAEEPDSIDVLLTTRNHDLKGERIGRPRPEHWIYALTSLQTMQGYSGKKNYGIARMNSGSGSRSAVSTLRSLDRSDQFRGDVAAWLVVREKLIADYGYPREGGEALLWTLPWDGESRLSLQQCDPFFLEICRRIRLVTEDGGIVARSGLSSGPRIGTETKGATGDVWTPIRLEDGAGYSVSSKGFSYDRLHALLFGGGYRLGPAAELPEAGSAWLLARGLARGQKTEGYHERLLPIPSRVRSIFRKPHERERLGREAKTRLEVVTKVRNEVLRPALCALLQEGTDRFKYDDKRLQPWLGKLDLAVDPIFFPELWRAVEEGAVEDHGARWARTVVGLAEGVLEEAIGSLPLPSVRKYRAIATAERVFHGAAHNRFDLRVDTASPSKGDADDAESRSA